MAKTAEEKAAAKAAREAEKAAAKAAAPSSAGEPKAKGFQVLDGNGKKYRVVETEEEAKELAKTIQGRFVVVK